MLNITQADRIRAVIHYKLYADWLLTGRGWMFSE